MTTPLLEVRNLSKSFPGVRALRAVSLHVNPGEVLAVIGENGAGKSTLMKILAGVQTADSGEVLIDGREVRFASVDEALRAGVVLIHQELNLCDNLSVAGNIYLGREPRRMGFVDRAAMERGAADVMRRVGLTDVSPRTLLSDLTIG